MGISVLTSAVVVWMLRNIGVLDAQGSELTLPVAELYRSVALQMTTMAGALIALVASALFVENTRTTNQRDLFVELETRPTRRWLVQLTAVLLGMLLAAILMVLMSSLAALGMSLLRGQHLRIDLKGWAPALDAALHGLPVFALFASGSILLSRVIKSGPIPTIGIGVVGIFNLLMIQHLTPAFLEKAVPTAWVGQWMRLTAEDHGAAYFWTTGAFSGGRGISEWLILASLALTCAIGIRLTGSWRG